MSTAKNNIAWDKVKAVVVDVDGTLYNQKALRGKMIKALLGYYLLRPWRFNDLKIISVFRKEREKLHTLNASNLEEFQYEICAKKVNQPVSRVKQVIDQWIFNHPLPFLKESMYPHVSEFFDLLKKNNIKIAIYSDYQAHEKLQAMNLQADMVVCSTDATIDQMKPSPKALFFIADTLEVKMRECVFIGDRDELDGACARQVAMPYIIVDKNGTGSTDLFVNLCEELKNAIGSSSWQRQ